MRKYVIVAESGADLPKDIVDRYGIYVVPMHVSFENETKDDGSFPIEELFGYFKKSGKLPKTSGSTPADFEIVFDQIHKEHPEAHIIHLAYSAVTTVAFQSAHIAAEGRDYVSSFDTKHVSAGQTMVVLAVARFLEANPDYPLEKIAGLVEELSKKCHMGFFPGDLIYLKAGGRVSNAAYLGAKLLSLNPLIELNNGYLEATKKYRGSMKKVAPKLLADMAAQYHMDKKTLIFVYAEGLDPAIHTDVEGKAKAMGFEEIFWVKTGCVVSTHSGPGGFGVVGFEG